MKTRLPLALALLLPLCATAQIYEYKDAAGRTVYTDQPPVGAAVKSRTVAKESAADQGASASTAAPVPKTAVDRELEFRKRQKEAQEQSAKAEKENADKAARKDECARARLQLQSLESGERIASRDAQGERVYMDDDQRAAEIARTRKAVSDLCR